MWRVLRAQSDFENTTLRNQLTSLVLYEVIVTSHTKGKALRSFADRFFNRVKKADLSAKKLAHQVLLDKNAVKKTFEDILPRFDISATNYVRAINATPRRGDNAKQIAVMLIEQVVKDQKAPITSEAKSATTKGKK